ncbi:hypothetical protein DVJ77_01225 [Dyella tabacisoli]|uniref:Uncharacterized protein n=1 Tax=Dyella tabacisoli TaxID=2282381 RepID=A0A369USG0_9GAMM|nr:hypothetical protein DVJ77_01225 [Dyella tabacisoli]
MIRFAAIDTVHELQWLWLGDTKRCKHPAHKTDNERKANVSQRKIASVMQISNTRALAVSSNA